MSDSKRSIADIQKEYTELCVKAGNLQYQIRTFEGELHKLNVSLRELNEEAFKVQEAEKAASPAPAVESGAV